MVICDRLHTLREDKKLSQGDIEKAHGSAALLHLARRERPDGAHSRDAGEDGARAGSAAVQAVL